MEKEKKNNNMNFILYKKQEIVIRHKKEAKYITNLSYHSLIGGDLIKTFS